MVKRKSWHLCSHQRGSGDVCDGSAGVRHDEDCGIGCTAVVDESVVGVFTVLHGEFLERDRKDVVVKVDCLQLNFEVPETHVGGGDVPDRDGAVAM